DFLVGTGAVVTGIVGAGMLAGCGGETETVTTTKTVSVPTTVTTTKTVGAGETATVTDIITETVGGDGTTVTKTLTTTVADGGVTPALEPEGTIYWAMERGGAACADTKNGRIIRIRPFHFDAKYDAAHINPWTYTFAGNTTTAPTKTLFQTGTDVGYRKRIYSTNRIKYPLKRVDWEPGGDPATMNTQNRGISKYERITWDEASDLVVSELKRIQAKYGEYAVFVQGDYHGQSKTIHSRHANHIMLLRESGLGYTLSTRNPDSWEGWFGGTKHVWGEGSMGRYYPSTGASQDVFEKCKLHFWFGDDPYTTGTTGNAPGMFFAEDCGVKHIWITPDLNYTASVHASKWIPVYPNTDAALELAVAYIWITEGTYDKDYVATHVYGFEEFEDYVLGNEAGDTEGPKTPAWASPLCGVPEWTIKALARQYASKLTSYQAGGGKIRGPYAHETARLEVYLMAMQGLGGPGRHAHTTPAVNPPGKVKRVSVGAIGRALRLYKVMVPQNIAKLKIQQAILDHSMDNPLSWYGAPDSGQAVENQFKKYTYPIPAEEGGTEIHMMWSDCPGYLANWTGGSRYIEALRSSKIECHVVQHPWLENETVLADIILPSDTPVEEDDIMAKSDCLYLTRGIENIGESMSDYEGLMGIADKLGTYGEYTGNKSVEGWMEYGLEKSGLKDEVSWEELSSEEYYYTIPFKSEWYAGPIGMQAFYEDPAGNPLHTKSGLLEFHAQWLGENFPDDKERPPVAHWIIGGPKEDGWTHDESKFGEKAKTYPLPLVSNHPRWRNHAQNDDMTWSREIETCKVKGPDGYMYEPLWLHPTEAAKRGIKNGDIVKIYNERGIVLGGARVTERLIPGAASQDHGARTDLITSWPGLNLDSTGTGGLIDRGGNNNLIAPEETMSKNYTGMASNNFLVEVEKLDPAEMEEWRQQYPEPFAKEYDASGPVFGNWVVSKAPAEPTKPPGPPVIEPTVAPTTTTTVQGPTVTFIPTGKPGQEFTIWDIVRIYLFKMVKTETSVIVEGNTTGLVGTDDYYYDLEVNFLDEAGEVLYTAERQTFRVGAHKTATYEYIYETAEPEKVESFNFVAYKIEQPAE
ncbi:molybdopterin-dependent oxidoreductase, partial [Chloroflexota bacterium]